MPGILQLATLSVLFATATFALAFEERQTALQCREITIPVDVSAQNKNLSPTLNVGLSSDSAALNKLLAGVSSSLVQGTYNISARYCEPATKISSRRDTLQVLVHGIAYDLNYWSGLAPPGNWTGQDQYSWIKYASDQGYPTLSVDRLCNGGSSRPQSIAICQLPLQVETLHAIVTAARAGTIPTTGRRFGKIVYVGHSYGSLVGAGLASQHPSDVDAYIMSGFSQKLTQGEAGILVLPLFQPAALVSPGKFGNLLLDPGYLTATSRSGARTVFYHGEFDPAAFDVDFANRGTVTLGEVVTAQLGQLDAPDFRGALFVLNGNEDGIFCEDGPLQALAGVPGNCLKGYSSGVQRQFAGASRFGFHNTANTGHSLNTHRTAQESFKAAHDFLAGLGAE